MTITILKRYDVNGAFTGDFDIQVGAYEPPSNSMYRVDRIVDIDLDALYLLPDLRKEISDDDQEPVHFIELGAGNITYCGEEFEHTGEDWTLKWTAYHKNATCEKCLDKLKK
jgi:hypothetical protein